MRGCRSQPNPGSARATPPPAQTADTDRRTPVDIDGGQETESLFVPGSDNSALPEISLTLADMRADSPGDDNADNADNDNSCHNNQRNSQQ